MKKVAGFEPLRAWCSMEVHQQQIPVAFGPVKTALVGDHMRVVMYASWSGIVPCKGSIGAGAAGVSPLGRLSTFTANCTLRLPATHQLS